MLVGLKITKMEGGEKERIKIYYTRNTTSYMDTYGDVTDNNNDKTLRSKTNLS